MTRVRSALRRVAVGVCLCFVVASPLTAQTTAVVPIDDPAYLWLDRLEALGVVDSAVMGQRPYSYREMGRLARAARATAARAGVDEQRLVFALLDRLDARVAARQPLVPLEDLLLVVTGTDAVRRSPPPAATSSPPQATIDPLASRRLGDPAIRGETATLELLQRAEPSSWVAIQGRERVEARHAADGAAPATTASVLEASLRTRWRNLALSAGRQQVGWGSGAEGGLILAAHAPALDQVSLASDEPFLLPSVFRGMGPVAATLLLADMGPSLVRSHSKLLAYKVSARPTVSFELGATVENHFGGEGGRPSPFLDRLIDFLPFVDVFRRHNYTDSTRTLDVDSDKVLGVDARWRIQRLGGATVAGEWVLDDFDIGRLASVFNYAASQTLGVIVPRVGSPGLAVRLRVTHIGPLSYNHASLTQGMTTRNRLLGDELGPDSKGYFAGLDWSRDPGLCVSIDGMVGIQSNATYAVGYDAAGSLIVRRASAAPDELREQAIVTLVRAPSPAAALTVRAGATRIRNVMFVGGRRHDWVLDVGMRWRP